jgi:hypothetical protein
MKTAEEIVQLYKARKASLGVDFQRMREIQAVMNNEIVLPLPELQDDERPAVANLAQQGMQQLSRRIASVPPMHYWPAMKPGQKASEERATNRRKIMQGWHHDNKMKRRIGKRGRFFLAYACAPVLIRPDPKLKIPRWIVKNPLHTFPGEDAFDDHTPSDCIFVTSHTYAGLLTSFPEAVENVTKPDNWDFHNDYNNYEIVFEMLEYWDADEMVLVLMGHERHNPYSGDPEKSGQEPIHEIITRAENLIPYCPVVIPGSINLDKQLGHFDGIVGMYQTQAALMALTIVGQRRTIWPREWLVSNPNETPEVIATPNPYKGQPGVLKGGSLETQNLDPSFSTLETMNMLEHAQRQTAALPAEFGGMSQSDNVRTGRRGAQVMGAAIDFTIAEAQDTFAESLVEENIRAIAIDKAYFNSPKTYHVATRSFVGAVNYTPEDVWETDKHVVDYPIAGTDVQNLPIEGGQRIAMLTLSREGFMEVDPMVADPKAEIQRMVREGVQTAFVSQVQTIASMPEGPYQPVDLARLDDLLGQGLDIYEAITILDEEVRERQATPAETPQQEQPGLAPPGQGTEQPPAIPEQGPSMSNLRNLLASLGTTQTAGKYRQ